VALVTGGGSGLGAAIASGLAGAGAEVHVADVDAGSAAAVASGCGGTAHQLDVADGAAVRAVVDEVAADHGIDVLVNSAGISARHAAEDFPEDEWDRIVAVNLKGSFLVCQAVGRHMLVARRGSIVNLASIGGSVAYPHTTAYLQSKGGVRHPDRRAREPRRPVDQPLHPRPDAPRAPGRARRDRGAGAVPRLGCRGDGDRSCAERRRRLPRGLTRCVRQTIDYPRRVPMMTKRLVVLAMAALLLACSGGGGTSEPTEDAEPADAAPTAPAATEDPEVTESTTEQATDAEATADPATEEPVAVAEDLPEVTLQVAYNVPEGTVTGQVLTRVAERVAERTDGGLTLELFPASQLGAVQDTLDQAASGANIVSNGEPRILSEYGAPDLGILTGPFLLDDPSQWRPLADSDLVQELLEDVRASSGLRVLDLGWYVGERHVMGNAAYPTAADMAGVRIRIPPLPAWEVAFEALDASAVTIDFAEVYSALSQGVVDAAEAPLSTLLASSFQEVSDQITLTAHFRQFQGFAMSDAVFTSLPQEYQDVLLEEFRTGGDEATQAEIDSQATARAELEAAGVTFTEADTDSYREATASFYDAFPEWSDGLYEEVQALLEEAA
jgi:TRAP-type C4-dicarboxylate transport system substrate-binding protein